MKKNHKATFINLYGQEMWNLRYAYTNKGDRSPEATEAERLYCQIAHGLIQDIWTIYSISENGKIVYIGKTGLDYRKRWACHKTRARSLNKASPIHCHMNNTSTNHEFFPEFTFQVITTTTDQKTAEDLEIAYIKAFKTHIDGFNKKMGGGSSKKYSTRPTNIPNDISTRSQSI